MSVIIITSSIVIAALFGFYFFLRSKEAKSILIKMDEFGKADKTRQKGGEQIIAQKIRHKDMSFYSYLISLGISFLLGAFAIYKIIHLGMSWKLLPDAFAISGGVLATVSFKRLYNKCSRDLEDTI